MYETNSFARMESLCLFNFGLRSRIRNMNKKHVSYSGPSKLNRVIPSAQNCLFHTFFSPPFILYFRILLFLLFVCKYLLLTFYPIVSEIVYMRNYFIHELELENDRGAVETSFVFFIACFYHKMFY